MSANPNWPRWIRASLAFTEAQNELIATKARADELRSALSNFEQTRVILEDNRQEIALVGREIQNSINGISASPEVVETVRDLGQELERLSTTRVSDLDVANFITRLNELKSETEPGFFEALFPNELLDVIVPQLDAARQSLEDLKATPSALETSGTSALEEHLRQAEQVLSVAPQFASSLQSGAEALARQGVSDSSQIAQNAITARDALASGARSLAAASNVRLNPDQRSTGGLIFRQGGGFTPRGTDAVPAMLSPGEFVVNRNATRRFFSELRAINAGLSPQFRESGGSVTQMGDVTVNVNESTSPKTTAREVVTLIKREFRRGTSKL